MTSKLFFWLRKCDLTSRPHGTKRVLELFFRRLYGVPRVKTHFDFQRLQAVSYPLVQCWGHHGSLSMLDQFITHYISFFWLPILVGNTYLSNSLFFFNNRKPIMLTLAHLLISFHGTQVNIIVSDHFGTRRHRSCPKRMANHYLFWMIPTNLLILTSNFTHMLVCHNSQNWLRMTIYFEI